MGMGLTGADLSSLAGGVGYNCTPALYLFLPIWWGLAPILGGTVYTYNKGIVIGDSAARRPHALSWA